MAKKNTNLLKIQEIAREVNLPATTIRYYTNIGLLKVTAYSPGGYRLFDREETLKNIEAIKKAIGRRTPLKEVKEKLGNANTRK